MRRVKEAFGLGRTEGLPGDDDRRDDEGGVGTREPRRPRPPVLTGGAALALPVEADEVRAVGWDSAVEE